ncbi:MAG: FkbM family methyltransferase [Phycisphaerales bacterium]
MPNAATKEHTQREIVALEDVRRSFTSSLGARIDHLYHAVIRRRFAAAARALGAHVPPGGVILDVGANHGRFAKHLAALHKRSVTLYAFEPIEYNLEMLRLVVGRMPNVTIEPIALSDTAGEHDIYLPYKKASGRLSHGSAHLGTDSGRRSFGTSTAPDVCRTTIKTTRLDDWATRANLERLDLMKIDVEGAEALVIEGGIATITRFKPAIYAELIPGTPQRVGRTIDDVINPLRDLGYTMHMTDKRGATTREVTAHHPEGRDYLFLHPDRAG